MKLADVNCLGDLLDRLFERPARMDRLKHKRSGAHGATSLPKAVQIHDR